MKVCRSAVLFFFVVNICTGAFFSLPSVNATEKEIYVAGITSLRDADALARTQIDKIRQVNKELAPRTIIAEIVHFGDTLPPELNWIIDHLKQEGVRFQISLVQNRESLKVLDELNKAIDRTNLGLTYQIAYQPISQIKGDPKHKKLYLEIESRFKRYLKTIIIDIRYFFGLPRGISWIMYRDSFTKRTAEEHVVEALSALMQALVIYGIDYSILLQKSFENQNLNPVLGASTAAGFKLVTGYIERANNEFFVQGNHFDGEGNFKINRSFFLTAAYAHSIIIGLIVQSAARGISAVDGDLVVHTAWNSFLGLFAKALPMFLISKNQQKYTVLDDSSSAHHIKWMTIALNTLLGFSYQALKAIHLFESKFLDLSYVFIALGLGGLGFELWGYLTSDREKDESWVEAGLDKLSKDLHKLKKKLSSKNHQHKNNKDKKCLSYLKTHPRTEIKFWSSDD